MIVSKAYSHASHSQRCRTRRSSTYSDHSGMNRLSLRCAHGMCERNRANFMGRVPQIALRAHYMRGVLVDLLKTSADNEAAVLTFFLPARRSFYAVHPALKSA